MSNDELEKYGFELCEFDGECDSCENEHVAQEDYFWRSTSHEYVEGDYYCRECASKEVSAFEGFLTQLAPDKWESAPSTGIVPPLSLSTSQSESTPPTCG